MTLDELEARITIVRENIRQLVEQAAGSGGVRDDELTSNRISQQTQELEKLIKERDALQKR